MSVCDADFDPVLKTKAMIRRIGLVVAFAGMTVVGCGGSPSAPTPPNQTAQTNAEPNATLSAVQSQIFTPKCVGCHGTVSPSGSLNLVAGRAYTNLVTVNSSQTSLVRVVPGKPNDSYLIDKLEGRSGIVGNRMPQGGPFLTAVEVDLIKQWISDGAQNN